MRKSEFYGDSAQFFFRQAIGIGAGERFNQSTLSVIHVAGSCYDEMLNGGHFYFLGATTPTAPESL